MSKKSYQPIDESVARQISAIHENYPKLGHHGILSALQDEDIRVDPQELQRYMADHKVKPEEPFKPMKFRGPPSWLGGNPEGDQ